MNVSTITLLFKVIPGYMFRLDLVILRPVLIIVLPDTVHTLGSHRVYVRGIHLKSGWEVSTHSEMVITSIIPKQR